MRHLWALARKPPDHEVDPLELVNVAQRPEHQLAELTLRRIFEQNWQ